MSIPIDGMNINNYYNNTYAAAADSKANSLEDTLNSDLSKATDEELMNVCKDFEAYFVEQMLKAMQKMIPDYEETSASTKQLQDYYKDEMVKSIAESSTENGGLGLAQTLYEQMKRNYNL